MMSGLRPMLAEGSRVPRQPVDRTTAAEPVDVELTAVVHTTIQAANLREHGIEAVSYGDILDGVRVDRAQVYVDRRTSALGDSVARRLRKQGIAAHVYIEGLDPERQGGLS